MTPEITIAPGASRDFSSFDKALIAPTLVHFDILADCPDGDVRVVRSLAILMWLSFGWECILFANAAHIMLTSDGAWHIHLVAVAVLMALIVLLADSLIFISSAWTTHGIAELERTHKFKLPRSPSDHVKGATLLGGRFVMALLIANFMAVTTGLVAFEKDINRILWDRYLLANASLFSAAAGREDGELQKNKAAQQELSGLIAQLEAEEKGLRSLSLEPKVDDSEIKLALRAVAAAQAAKAAADADLKSAEVHSARERGGQCKLGGVSCRPGAGPRWRAAQERIAASEREVAATSRNLDSAQQTLDRLSAAQKVEGRRREGLADTRLAEVMQHKAKLERQAAALRTEYSKRFAARETTIRSAVERDPQRVPRPDGLLARLQALHELSKDESIRLALYGFDAILILLELAAVMGKSFALIPMTYATRIVELDLAREIETARRLQLLMTDAPQLVPEQAPIIVKAEEAGVTATSTPVPPDPQPVTGSEDRTRRHAPRWKPNLTNGETGPPS
jgi:hypothetical protein